MIYFIIKLINGLFYDNSNILNILLNILIQTKFYFKIFKNRKFYINCLWFKIFKGLFLYNHIH